MTIAEQIKYFHIEINDGIESVKDNDAFIAECEDKAVDSEQDWDNETTTYEFVDGSVIVWNNSEIYVYGSRN